MSTNDTSAAPSRQRFTGKVALITGASDHGIGGAIATRMANEGAAVVIASRTHPQRLLKQLSRRGRAAQFLPCDVTCEGEVRAAVGACIAEQGRIDILVNNAGVEQIGRLDQLDEATLTQVVDTNLTGAIRVTRAVLSHLPSPGGVIVNVSSVLGLAGCTGFTVYSASKAGLNGFTQSLAWELAPRGIRVVAVAPGVVLTPMSARYHDELPPEKAHQVRDCHPLDVGLTSDVAAAAAFLASDEARWITGVILPVGWTPHFPLPVEDYLAGTHGQSTPETEPRSTPLPR